MVDQLAQEYAGRPVIFIEQDVDNPLGERNWRWWAAFQAAGNEGSAVLPEAMVDSGHQVTDGSLVFSGGSFYDTYKGMVEAELARPPGALVDAYWQRVEDRLVVTAWVTNRSGVALSSATNGAAVHLVVYEDKHVLLTDRFVRAATARSVYPALAPGDTTAFTLETSSLSGVNWDALHALVLVDYRPAAGNGAYDMLQASLAKAFEVTVKPDSVGFFVDPSGPAPPSVPLQVRGVYQSWTATEELGWLDVAPTNGAPADFPTLSVIPGALAPGWQRGNVTITVSGVDGSQSPVTIQVSAYYGETERRFLPIVTHP